MFGGVETGQVFVVFDDIHLFTGPTKQKKSYYDYGQKISPSTTQKRVHKINRWKILISALLEEKYYIFNYTADEKNDNQWLSVSQLM